MALRQLILTKRISELKAKLEALRSKDEDFETRVAEMQKREAELEASVEEITEATSEDDRKIVDEAVAEFELEQEALKVEREENEVEKTKLQDEIQKLTDELEEINKKAAPVPAGAERQNERTVKNNMEIRKGFFSGMHSEQRDSIIASTEVKEFLSRVRELKGQNRAVTGAELQIPVTLLDVLRNNLDRYSKLIKYVRLKPVAGKARQTIAGAVPEGIWTEAVGVLNELAFAYAQVEVDGYKVGGFVPVPNSTLEDSDINLATDLMDGIGQAIGLAVDKAIIYGNRAKMLQGIVTRLAQESKPSDWPQKGPDWTDLHTTHILKINPASYTTAEDFWAAVLVKLGVAEPDYAVGNTFWAMNHKTKMALMAKCVSFNAAGALVAGQMGTMPIEGGDIVELSFIPDNDIVGGYGSLYLLAERAGADVSSSEHVKFIEDQTVFKGTARYDGMPIRGEAFVVINIANTDPTTTVIFAQDLANTVATPKALPTAGSYTGAQSVALSCDTPGATIYYTTNGSTPTTSSTAYNGPIAVAATATIKAIAVKSGMTNSVVMTAAYTIS
ncbi:Phage capsid protein [Desulfitobacterium hafniense]|uniref:Phage capsid protein n=1 Tax=Desulfitobacterium hafniense TaxID=49338 RepID=A0A098AUW7_DESHA|nr:phage major capsid protein [Desulfitobacterium hafniense]CDV96358.1 Phage capsid protein [Desulfitobacterium hafniense]